MLSRRKALAVRITSGRTAGPCRNQPRLMPSAVSQPCCGCDPNSRTSAASSRWATSHEAEPPGWAYFHIVTKGGCLLERRDGRRLRLDAGDLLLLPHGDAHIVRSRDARGGSYGPPVTVAYNNAIRIKTNTDQPATELICGRLRFEAAPDNLVIAALPDTIVLKLGGQGVLKQMRSLVLAIRDELDGDRQGAAAIAADLARALLVMMLRLHFEEAAAADGLMRLLASRPTARPAQAMLRDPARDWTLDELANEAHVSRATLVRAFRQAGAWPRWRSWPSSGCHWRAESSPEPVPSWLKSLPRSATGPRAPSRGRSSDASGSAQAKLATSIKHRPDRGHGETPHRWWRDLTTRRYRRCARSPMPTTWTNAMPSSCLD